MSKEQEAPKKEQDNDLMDKMRELTETVGILARAVVDLQKKDEKTAPKVQKIGKKEEKKSRFMTAIPPEWVEAKEKFFGEEFKMTMEWLQSGDTMMHIIVPEKYRRPDSKSKEIDESTGLIRKTSPVEDITKWCGLIKTNIQKFYPDYK